MVPERLLACRSRVLGPNEPSHAPGQTEQIVPGPGPHGIVTPGSALNDARFRRHKEWLFTAQARFTAPGFTQR